jgi:uncharacterized membrane protein
MENLASTQNRAALPCSSNSHPPRERTRIPQSTLIAIYWSLPNWTAPTARPKMQMMPGKTSFMRLFILAISLLHATFMALELLPPKNPILLQVLSKKRLNQQGFSETQRSLVAIIVQNAGIYNGILAGGLAWSAFSSNTATAAGVALVLLVGAAVAGVFGTLTLKSPLTAIQGLAGIVGAFLVSSRGMG